MGVIEKFFTSWDEGRKNNFKNSLVCHSPRFL